MPNKLSRHSIKSLIKSRFLHCAILKRQRRLYFITHFKRNYLVRNVSRLAKLRRKRIRILWEIKLICLAISVLFPFSFESANFLTWLNPSPNGENNGLRSLTHSLIHSFIPSLSSKVELPERGSLIFQSDLILRAIPRRATCSRKEWDYNFSGFQPTLALRGLPYMTSALGGVPKSRQKEQNQLISIWEGVKKSQNFVDVIYGSPLTWIHNFSTTHYSLLPPNHFSVHAERVYAWVVALKVPQLKRSTCMRDHVASIAAVVGSLIIFCYKTSLWIPWQDTRIGRDSLARSTRFYPLAQHVGRSMDRLQRRSPTTPSLNFTRTGGRLDWLRAHISWVMDDLGERLNVMIRLSLNASKFCCLRPV